MACHPLATGGHTVPISSLRASFSSPDDDGRAVSIRSPVGYGRAVTHRHDAARSPPAGCGSPETGALRPSRGRTQRHAVVPSDAGSYPNSRGRTLEPFQRTTARIRVRPRGKRYDHPNSRTTARYEVRPRNALYDRAYPGTTARPRSPSRMRMGALRGRPGPPASLQAVADAEGGPALARAQRALHGDDGRVPVGIAAPARSGPPCAHRAHGPPRRVTGSASARRHEPDQDRPGLPGRGNETAHWWLGHRGSAPSESRSTSRAPRRPSAPPDNDTALSTKNATRNKDAPPLRGSVLRGRPPPRSGRRRSPCRSSRRAPPRDGRPAADTSPGSAPPDTCDADL